MASTQNRARRILAIGAHCDDVELGCGATLFQHRAASARVVALILSSSFRGIYLDGIAPAALRELRVEESSALQYHPRELGRHRQAIHEAMAEFRDKLQPDIVLVPDADEHDDHVTTYREAVKAFRRATVYAYEIARSNPAFTPTTYQAVSRQAVDAKIRALDCYQAAIGPLPYLDSCHVLGTLRHRGIYCEADYAEAFRLVHSAEGIP